MKSRPAQVGEQLVVRDFRTGSKGFSDLTYADTAVCLLPGTELAFDEPIKSAYLPENKSACVQYAAQKTAIFRQREKENPNPHLHHDMLELPDGRCVLLTHLYEGQLATVLQLPAAPRNEQEADEQRRAVYA